MKNNWKIEYYSIVFEKWVYVSGFTHMNKSYAKGAWQMLKSYYNHKYEHRLVNGDEVIETMGKQIIKLS